MPRCATVAVLVVAGCSGDGTGTETACNGVGQPSCESPNPPPPPDQIDLAVAASLARADAGSGQLRLVVEIENRGPDPARDVLVSIQIPADVVFVEASVRCGEYVAGTLDCTSMSPGSFPAPAVGEIASLWATFDMAADAEPSARQFVVSARHSQTDPDPDNNTVRVDLPE